MMSSLLDESSDDEISVSDMSDENVDDDDDEEEDPNYVPSGVIEDEVHTETQSSTEETLSVPMDDEVHAERESTTDNQYVAVHENKENGESSRHLEAVEEVEKSVLPASQGSSEEICSICFEPWTNSSEHRLVSLRCGHLFGRSCISQWLRGQNSRCPQCNARARRSEIRNIYARSIKVIDSSERDKALEDLNKEKELRKAAEMEAAQERMKRCLMVQECERLKKELMEAQKQLQEFRSGLNKNMSSQIARDKHPLNLLEKINIIKEGGCRIINSGELLGMLLVSQPSTNQLFPGFGFRKISTMSMKPCDFVLVHKKLIRDMAFHKHDGLVLTASVDKSLKITNVITNTVVQTYDVESDVWSCAWDAENSMYFYGGLRTGEAYVYDIRVTNRHVCELPRFGTKTPVVSLQYLCPSEFPTSSYKNGGPIVGKLSDCALHQKTQTDGIYNLVPMPSLGPFTCLSSGAPGQLLVSCRPSPKQPSISHTFCDFTMGQSGELVCCPVKTVFGGRTQVQLTRSKLFKHPDNASSVLICAGDEDANGALIWDGVSGDVLDNLRTDSPVLDLDGLKMDHKFYLTALTSSALHLYGWNHQ